MEIKVSRHVFGSIKGYTTLAKSIGVTTREETELEYFAYGQTNDHTYLESLKTNPAYVCKKLGSGRWGITRFFKGNLDTAKRTTMLFMTAILKENDWLDTLGCDIHPVISSKELWEWNYSDDLSEMTIRDVCSEKNIHIEVRKKVVSLLSAIEELKDSNNTTLLTKATEYDMNTLRLVHMILPKNERVRFSYAVRSLSDGLPLTVISMADVGSYGKSKNRTVFHTGEKLLDRTPYAKTINEMWESNEELLLKYTNKCKTFFGAKGIEPAHSHISNYSDETRFYRKETPVITQRIPSILKSWGPIAVVIILMAILSGIFIYDKIESKVKASRLTKETNTFLQDYNDCLKSKKKFLDKESNLLSQKIENMLTETKDERLEYAQKNLKNFTKEYTEKFKKLDNVEELLQKCNRLNLKATKSYPEPDEVRKVENAKNELNKNLVHAEEVGKLDNAYQAIEKIRKWENNILSVVESLTDQLKKDSQSANQKYYNEEGYKRNEEAIKEFQKLTKNTSLANALHSPIVEHAHIAEKINKKLEEAIDSTKSNRDTMDEHKKTAESHCKRANELLGNVNTYEDIYKTTYELSEAEKHYPGGSDINKLKEKIFARGDSLPKKFSDDYDIPQIKQGLEYLKTEPSVENETFKNKKDEWVREMESTLETVKEKVEKKLDNADKHLTNPKKDIDDICIAIYDLEAIEKSGAKKLPSLQGIAERKFNNLVGNRVRSGDVEMAKKLMKKLDREKFNSKLFEDIRKKAIKELNEIIDDKKS